MVYTVTKIFGVDAVKTRVFYEREDAINDIKENIAMLQEDDSTTEVQEKSNGETYYIIKKSEDPTEYIEIILRRCEIK